MAICFECKYGGATVYVDDRYCAKTPEEKAQVDLEISKVLYGSILSDPKIVKQLRQYNIEHYGTGE